MDGIWQRMRKTGHPREESMNNNNNNKQAWIHVVYLGYLPRYTMRVHSPLPMSGIAPQQEYVLLLSPIHLHILQCPAQILPPL